MLGLICHILYVSMQLMFFNIQILHKVLLMRYFKSFIYPIIYFIPKSRKKKLKHITFAYIIYKVKSFNLKLMELLLKQNIFLLQRYLHVFS